MKNSWITPLIILVIICVLYGIYRAEFKKANRVVLEENEMIIKKSVWDSLSLLANKKPIVKIDTFYLAGKVKYVTKEVPIPVETDSLHIYSDSLVAPDINVRIYDMTSGKILSREWRYVPMIMQVKEFRTEYVPQIINNPVKVPIPKNGFYIYGIAGGNESTFTFGTGVDLITKKDRLIGYEFQRLGDKNIHSVKVGLQIKMPGR